MQIKILIFFFITYMTDRALQSARVGVIEMNIRLIASSTAGLIFFSILVICLTRFFLKMKKEAKQPKRIICMKEDYCKAYQSEYDDFKKMKYYTVKGHPLEELFTEAKNYFDVGERKEEDELIEAKFTKLASDYFKGNETFIKRIVSFINDLSFKGYIIMDLTRILGDDD